MTTAAQDSAERENSLDVSVRSGRDLVAKTRSENSVTTAHQRKNQSSKFSIIVAYISFGNCFSFLFIFSSYKLDIVHIQFTFPKCFPFSFLFSLTKSLLFRSYSRSR